jgi:hypothetical protein
VRQGGSVGRERNRKKKREKKRDKKKERERVIVCGIEIETAYSVWDTTVRQLVINKVCTVDMGLTPG